MKNCFMKDNAKPNLERLIAMITRDFQRSRSTAFIVGIGLK